MIIGCKNGCLCSDINKDYCCVECDNFNSCKEPCISFLNKRYDKEEVLNLCKKSFVKRED